jgi:hypothetical protein
MEKYVSCRGVDPATKLRGVYCVRWLVSRYRTREFVVGSETRPTPVDSPSLLRLDLQRAEMLGAAGGFPVDRLGGGAHGAVQLDPAEGEHEQ